MVSARIFLANSSTLVRAIIRMKPPGTRSIRLTASSVQISGASPAGFDGGTVSLTTSATGP